MEPALWALGDVSVQIHRLQPMYPPHCGMLVEEEVVRDQGWKLYRNSVYFPLSFVVNLKLLKKLKLLYILKVKRSQRPSYFILKIQVKAYSNKYYYTNFSITINYANTNLYITLKSAIKLNFKILEKTLYFTVKFNLQMHQYGGITKDCIIIWCDCELTKIIMGYRKMWQKQQLCSRCRG